MEARADFEQTCEPPAQDGPAAGGLGDAAEYLEERALASAVATDDTKDFAAFYLEADITESPELVGCRRGRR